jgi:hypothetical protein
MTDEALPPIEPPRRLHFGWILPAIFQPRPTFNKIALYEHGAWLTPILLLIVFALARVFVAGPLQLAALQSAQPVLPQGFETMPPDQQQQILDGQAQAQSLTNGPMFVYAFPAAGAVLGTIVGWLVTFGSLHLILTLLGGRGSTRSTMNIMAWASLPFLVRDIVRIGYMLVTQKIIVSPGLSGFALTEGSLTPFIVALLGQIDIYLFWYILLIVLGVTASDKLSGVKALGGVVFTIFILMLLQAAPGLLVSLFAGVASGG